MVMEIGSVVMKTAGRDAGCRGVILEVDGNMALLDGETRRRKTNLAHLEPTGQKIDVKKGASHDEVKKALSSLEITARDTKPKKAGEKPKRVRKAKEKPVEGKEAGKKATKATSEKPAEKKEEKKATKSVPKEETKSAPKKTEAKK